MIDNKCIPNTKLVFIGALVIWVGIRRVKRVDCFLHFNF